MEISLRRWLNPRVFKHCAALVFGWTMKKGIVIENDVVINSKLQAIFFPVFMALQSDIIPTGLSLLYSYNCENQETEVGNALGWSSIYITEAGKISAIGISKQAIEKGDDFAVLTLLHELTHIITELDHDTGLFHAHLDSLIEKYNEATGSHIENDYNGLKKK